MKADVVLIVKIDVSQASAVIERMQQVLAEEFGVPAPESAAAHANLPEEGSRWKNKDSGNAIWQVTSSRMSRVHAQVFMGSGPINGWTGTAAEFLNEFRPVPKMPEMNSEWKHREAGGLWRVVPRLQDADQKNPVRVEQVGSPWKHWTGLVAEFNHLFVEADS